MIIDCHCHAGRGDGMTAPGDTDAPLDRDLERARRAGIERTVLFAAFHSDFAVANHEVARIVASQPGRFYGFAFVDSVHDRGRIHDLFRDRIIFPIADPRGRSDPERPRSWARRSRSCAPRSRDTASAASRYTAITAT